MSLLCALSLRICVFVVWDVVYINLWWRLRLLDAEAASLNKHAGTEPPRQARNGTVIFSFGKIELCQATRKVIAGKVLIRRKTKA